MKKITLILLIALGFSVGAFGQAIVTIQAPQTDGSWTTLHAPSGSVNAVSHKACYLVLKTELTGLANTNSVITGFGFDFLNGVNAATSGQFTVYLQNTADVAYSKGANFAAAIAPMSTNFIGTYGIPVSAGATQTILTLTNSFNYTGGGIYVAIEWSSPSAAATTPARYLSNTTDLVPIGGGYTLTPTGPAATTMSLDVFRPAFLWQAANTLTNEVSVTRLDPYGKVSKAFNSPQIITTQVRNNSNTALSNVSVSLSITGANPFSDVQTIPNFAAGSFSTISFAAYNTPASGLSNMLVSVASDQDNANNTRAWSQSVTCNEMALNPPAAANAFTNNTYQWASGGGIYSYRINTPATTTLSGIRFAVSSFTNVTGKNIYGVLLSSAGAIIATTNTINVTQSQLGTFVTFNFASGQVLTGGTNYNIGVAQPDFPCQVFGSISTDIAKTYLCALGGGAFSIANRGYMGMEAMLSFTSALTATPSKTVVCKKDGPNTVTITAAGLSSYSWTASGTSTAPATGTIVTVTPATTGTAGGITSFSVTGFDAVTGCKSNAAVVTISVSLCTGIASNTSNGYDIKLFPNPAVSGKANITGLVGTNALTVYNTLGQVVLTQIVSDETTSLDLSNQPSGNYLVKITDSNNETRTIKVVNQN